MSESAHNAPSQGAGTPLDSQDSRIAAVVLAAGLSRRMGRVKSLLPFGDKPLLARVVEGIVSAGGIDPIVVVTGYAAEQVAPVLENYPVRPVHNPAYASGGMLSSIQTGLAAVRRDADAVLIVLGDQPMVRAETINAITSAWSRSRPRPRVILPSHGGKHGHPILLSAAGIDEILSLSTEQSLKTYTNRHIEQTVESEVDDPAILLDLDTPDDYAAALGRWQSSQMDVTVRS